MAIRHLPPSPRPARNVPIPAGIAPPATGRVASHGSPRTVPALTNNFASAARLLFLLVLTASIWHGASYREPAEAEETHRTASDAGVLELASPSAAYEGHDAALCPECLKTDAVAASPYDGARPLPPLQVPPPFSPQGKSAAVIDPACPTLLYGKDESERLPPASLTKIMTAIVARDLLPDVNAQVRVSISGSSLRRTTGSSVMGLEPGMSVSVLDLLYGLMLPSGNDAALALAQASAGDVDSFVRLMNEKAAALGLADTAFANPHGLDQQGLYSTAADMARLGIAMMQDPLLAQIAGTGSYTTSNGLQVRNGNKMLTQYPGSYGVKIGFTEAAQHTIVASAQKDGRHIYVSVLGSEASYEDAAALLDWAFQDTRAPC